MRGNSLSVSWNLCNAAPKLFSEQAFKKFCDDGFWDFCYRNAVDKNIWGHNSCASPKEYNFFLIISFVFFMKSSIRFLLLFCCIIVFNVSASGQIQEIDPEETNEETTAEMQNWLDRVVVGGGLSASFGDFASVYISPIVGYKVTDDLLAGIGFTYQYVSFNDPYNYYQDYKSNLIGGKVFGQYNLFYGLFAHLEYEQLWYDLKFEDGTFFAGKEPALFPGIGYNLKLGKSAYFQLMAMYNLLWQSDSFIYGNPFQIRMGFTIGL
jgi:hypothetical protein